jgi:hypothetical protein
MLQVRERCSQHDNRNCRNSANRLGMQLVSVARCKLLPSLFFIHKFSDLQEWIQGLLWLDHPVRKITYTLRICWCDEFVYLFMKVICGIFTTTCSVLYMLLDTCEGWTQWLVHSLWSSPRYWQENVNISNKYANIVGNVKKKVNFQGNDVNTCTNIYTKWRGSQTADLVTLTHPTTYLLYDSFYETVSYIYCHV